MGISTKCGSSPRNTDHLHEMRIISTERGYFHEILIISTKRGYYHEMHNTHGKWILQQNAHNLHKTRIYTRNADNIHGTWIFTWNSDIYTMVSTARMKKCNLAHKVTPYLYVLQQWLYGAQKLRPHLSHIVIGTTCKWT